MNKREFLKQIAVLGVGVLSSLSGFGMESSIAEKNAAAAPSNDEDYWLTVRKKYTLTTDYINLENGYYCIQPQDILEQYFSHIKEVNMQGAHYMRTVQFENKAKSVKRLAEIAGCSEEELIITRNTTESLDMIIGGWHWKEGDEAVMAEQDYGSMLDMFKQTSARYGMVNKIISLPLNPENDDQIVALYERAITPKTKLLMVCHIVNITGQILPVKKICDMAHRYGVPVMVDGAHSFAHLQFKIPDLNCDFYGCSLHKWLSAPLGAGMLYIKKEYFSKIYPVFADSSKKETDIARLNHTGTLPSATDLTIPDAVDFYLGIGAERKENRLRYLQNYWTRKVKHLPHVIYNTPIDEARSCAIANIGIKGMSPADMAKTLLDKYKIYTVAIDSAGVHGCRITPNVYTTEAELDVLVQALTKMR
jgi:selenocysteine lyase/cysteine desulfurase